MEITIIGTGTWPAASAVARSPAVTTRRVGKDSESAEAVAADIGGDGSVKTAVTGEPLEGDVVVLAVYNPDARAAVEQHADQLAGKVVVDITIRSTRTSTVSCCQPTGRPPRSSRASPQMHGS